MARPRVHDAATAEVLLTSAAELLRRGGLAAVSVRAVAEESGISFRAVYALFGSKQALVDGLAERGYRQLAHRVRRIPVTADPVKDLVEAGVQGFRAFATDDPAIFRLTFESVSPEVLQQERVASAAYEAYKALRDRVRHARSVGAVHPDRTDEECVLPFHGLCQGLASAELSSRPPPDGPGFWPMAQRLDLEAVWRDALRALVVGFRSDPARTPASEPDG